MEVNPPSREPRAPSQATAYEAPPSRASPDLDECADRIQNGEGLPASGSDRALYEKALATQRAGNLADARRNYFELIQQTPGSRFIPLAYLAFGDLFRERAKKEPAIASLALQAYRKVTSFPPPANTAYAYALLRMAETQAEAAPKPALEAYLRAAKAAVDSPCPDALGQAARAGMVQAYVHVGRPERAWALFRRAAPDDRTAADQLATLADKYNAAGRAADGCKAVRAASDAAVHASERLETAASGCRNSPQPQP